MEGREVEGRGQRRGGICEESGRGVLGEGTESRERERGRRGQGGKGVINERRVARRMAEETKRWSV